MSRNISVKDLMRDIKNAERHLRAAKKIIASEGDIGDLFRELESAQHASFDAKEQIVVATRSQA